MVTPSSYNRWVSPPPLPVWWEDPPPPLSALRGTPPPKIVPSLNQDQRKRNLPHVRSLQKNIYLKQDRDKKNIRREKKRPGQHGMAEPGTVLSDIHLRPALCHAFRDCKDLVGNMLVHVILAAVFADLGGDVLYDKGHPVPVKGDGCRALPGLTVSADDALHVLLRV